MRLAREFIRQAVLPQQYQSQRQGQFTLRRLHNTHVGDCMDLQKKILKTLPDDQTFIHVKEHQDYEHLSKNKGFLIGAFNNISGQLAGISAVRMPENKRDDAGVLGMDLPAKAKKVATIESVMVGPETQGHKLAEAMFHFAADALPPLGRDHALAIITRENFYSWRAFLGAGFEITGTEFDPSDNSTVYLAHRDLTTNRRKFIESASALSINPSLDLDHAKDLFAKGYRGVKWEKDDKLALRR